MNVAKLALTVGVIGAGVAAAIAVFNNRGAIGEAFTRGTENLVTRPFGNWLDNLFSDTSGGAGGGTGGASTVDSGGGGNNSVATNRMTGGGTNMGYTACANDPADMRTWCDGYMPPPDQDFLPPDQPQPGAAPRPRAPPAPPRVAPRPRAPPAPPRVAARPAPRARESGFGGTRAPAHSTGPLAGTSFYYIDYPGRSNDIIGQFAPAAVDYYRERASGVFNLGRSPPGTAGLDLFARSRNLYA